MATRADCHPGGSLPSFSVHPCIFDKCHDHPRNYKHGREPCGHLRIDLRYSSYWHTGILAYAARIAGVRTGHIATALTLFNLLILVSRTSNSFQAPFLAKRIETANSTSALPLLSDFHWILGSAALATALGACFVPSAQRPFARAVGGFSMSKNQ